MSKPVPTNKRLYNQVKAEAKKKFKTWPSAYGSAWLVKEYKRRGGSYSGKKSSTSGISRWMDEKWINVCKLPKKVSCGRPKLSYSEWKKKYPYCRPSIRITKSTPTTYKEISKSEIKRRCSIKRKNPLKRVLRSKSKRKSKSRRKSNSKRKSKSRRKSKSIRKSKSRRKSKSKRKSKSIRKSKSKRKSKSRRKRKY